MKPQKNQYTFRVSGTVEQYMENAFSEEEAKRQLGALLLQKDGVSPQSPEYQKLLSAYTTERLRMVYVR
ncbi:MAG: hypothetical protein NWR72_03620 [Bacteroidia bacterium]|nr:hypothetical protein [Bacteroidia bacterium]